MYGGKLVTPLYERKLFYCLEIGQGTARADLGLRALGFWSQNESLLL